MNLAEIVCLNVIKSNDIAGGGGWVHLEGTNGMAVHVFVWDCTIIYTYKIMAQAGIQCMSMDRNI